MRRPAGWSAISLAMRLVALCAWASAAASAAPAAAAPAGVDLVGASAGSIRFRVSVPDPVFETLVGDAEVSRLTIPGFSSAALDGEPALPSRVVTVAVPPTGEVRVSAMGVGAEGFENVLIASVRPLPRDEPGRLATSARDRQVPELVSVRPTRAGEASRGLHARLVGVTWMRNQRVAQIEVRPADYDLGRRRLSIARSVEVTVDVPPAGEPGRMAEELDPFESVYRGVLVNYEQGRAWRRPGRDGAAGVRGAAGIQGAVAVPDTSIYAGREWVKIAIRETGFYKIDFRLLRTLSPFNGSTTTPIDSVRMFTLPGLPVLPEDGYCDACEYQEVAIRVVDDGDLVFDNNDLDVVYFFALGPSDWANLYDPSQPDTSFVNHPYANENYYYIGIGTPELPFGKAVRRMATENGTPPATPGGEVTPASFAARQHFEVDSASEYWPDSYPHSLFARSTIAWEKWFWASIGRGNAFTVDADMPGLDPAQPARMRMRAWGVSPNVPRSQSIFDHYLDVSFNGQVMPREGWYGRTQRTYDTLLTTPLEFGNQLRISVPFVQDPNPDYELGRVDQSGLAWMDLFYQRRFIPVASRLNFDSSPSGGSYLYAIEPFTLAPNEQPRIFDVTDPLAPIEILGAAYEETSAGSGEYRLRFTRTETGQRRYRVLPEAAITRPNNADVFTAPRSSLSNLRSATQQADYLVIYFDGFRAATDSLLRWRRENLAMQGRSAPFDTAAVPISALYDQFSGGRPDPGAIRAFLRSAYFNWRKAPAFVTILGDASYDFKNVAGFAPPGQPASLVPTYEGGFDFVLLRQFATDDWILNVTDEVGGLGIPDFIGGRIPAGDVAAAMTYVRDKLLAYERRAPLGEWRNRVMLIADDNEQGSRVDGLGWTHLCQTANLDSVHTPQHMDREYVYLHTYPDGPGDTKPGAKADILRLWNEGVLLSNYIGHGSAFKIADESVFLETDVPSLRNMTVPSVFVAASCDVGKFHDPQFSGIGEKLVMSGVGGCVAVISATEEAFSGQNVLLNNELYDRVTERDPAAGSYDVALADALLAAKIATTNPIYGNTNNAKYQLLGDAATRLALPRLYAELSIEDANGTPITQVARGQTVTFRGRILDRPGGAPVPFVGNVGLLIEDSAPLGTVPRGWQCDDYVFRAAPMFRGDVGVTGGQFTGRFIVPMNAVAGPRGKLRAYSQGLAGGEAFTSDGAGSMPFTLVGGTAPAGDNEGPTVKLSFAGGSTSVRPDALLKVELFDVNGILTTGHSQQNAIVVTVDDDVTSRKDISESFRYAANSYQSGTASFQLPGLAPGPHNIKVSAADNLASGIDAFQHRSSATISFEVTDNPPLEVTRTFLFPNPTVSGGLHSGGQFVVDAPGDPVNVLLRVFTISGRLIRTLKAFGGLGQVQISWDGLDDEGYPLALGTYVYQVHVNPRDADGTSSPRLKAVAEGRFVIVGHDP